MCKYASGLMLQKVQEGGYVVTGIPLSRDGFMNQMLFAATTVEEALKFMKKRIDVEASSI